MSGYLLIIAKSYFLKKILKLINVRKMYFKKGLVADMKYQFDLFYFPEINTPLSSSLVTRAKYTINTILKWVNYIWKTLTLNSNNFWLFPLVNAFCIIALVHSLYFICSLNSCALFISNLFSQDILNEEKWIKAKNIKQSWFVLHIFRKKS